MVEGCPACANGRCNTSDNSGDGGFMALVRAFTPFLDGLLRVAYSLSARGGGAFGGGFGNYAQGGFGGGYGTGGFGPYGQGGGYPSSPFGAPGYNGYGGGLSPFVSPYANPGYGGAYNPGYRPFG